MQSDLIYDVGMHNGDDTAYYLHRGFSVVAIEGNPVLVERASERFRREIDRGRLTILNIGVCDRTGALPFWICDSVAEWSSFDRTIASRDGAKHHQVTIPTRRFRPILDEFGVPSYLKMDIEGSEIHCLRDLAGPDLPTYVSFEKTANWTTESLTILHELGYTGFKLISQFHFLPLEHPPSRAQREYERRRRAQRLLDSGNLFVRAARRAGARRWLEREARGTGAAGDWAFPPGSSGPFGKDLPGRWQSFDEIRETLDAANREWASKAPSLFWGDQDYSFWADFHAMRPA